MGGGIITAGAAIVLAELGLVISLTTAIFVFAFWIVIGLTLGQSPKTARRRVQTAKCLRTIATKYAILYIT